MQRLSITHVRQWQEHRHKVGEGHIYQGRYKSFPIERDEHFLTVCRYVERNPLRAGLCARAEQWRWSSLWRALHGDDDAKRLLSAWPVERPPDWRRRLHRAQSEAELERLRQSAQRGQPFGKAGWVERMVERFALASTLRAQGRPRKESRRNGS